MWVEDYQRLKDGSLPMKQPLASHRTCIEEYRIPGRSIVRITSDHCN